MSPDSVLFGAEVVVIGMFTCDTCSFLSCNIPYVTDYLLMMEGLRNTINPQKFSFSYILVLVPMKKNFIRDIGTVL